MPTVASVRLRYMPKEYWFDPSGIEVHEGDHVLVQTERGRELGLCIKAALEVTDKQLKTPLKPILRVATDLDYDKVDRLDEKGHEAMHTFRELVNKHKLDMKPIAVEFMFDESHATFYFTSERRVDFRALVRDLASEYHVRVDMRQVGVRDEARMIGGLGHCGQELCCAVLSGDFQPVSIRMAKEQDLPLNPSKISGQCGRLMCCLRYEFETYKEFKARAPKKNAIIDTPKGLAKVVEIDTPREKVRIRFEDGKALDVPVNAMDTGNKKASQEGQRLRPCHISDEMFDKLIEELHHDNNLAMMGEKLFSDNPELADTTAEAGFVEHTHRKRRKRSRSNSGGASSDNSHSSRRSGTEPKHGGDGSERHHDSGHAQPRKRRRSVSVTGNEMPTRDRSNSKQRTDSNKRYDSHKEQTPGSQNRHNAHRTNKRRQRRRARGNNKPHPGQHSSTVSGD